jgi:hypothetical protein
VEGFLGLGELLLCRQVEKADRWLDVLYPVDYTEIIPPFCHFRSLVDSTTMENSDVKSENLNRGASPVLVDSLVALVQLLFSDSVFTLVHEDRPGCCVAKKTCR